MRARAAFSREQEKDADSYGTVLLTRAGFKPDAMLKMLGKLAILDGGQATHWSMDHPGALDRITLVEPRVEDEEHNLLTQSLAEKGDSKALASQINAWLKKLPESGNAWYHKAVILQKLRSADTLEALERAVSRHSPSISQPDDQVAEVWLALCVGLYKAGFKLESANCSRRLGGDLREQYRAATFGNKLVVGGQERALMNVMTGTDREGRKVFTNQDSTLRLRGIPVGDVVAPWKPVRFPPNGADRELRER